MTTEGLARDIWHFLKRPGSAHVSVMCQSIQGDGPTKNIAAVLRVMFEGLDRAGLKLKFERLTATEWILSDERTLRIETSGASESSASKKGRSGDVTRLHCTETAFYDFPDQTLNAVMECIPANDSEVVFESTANGASGYFYNQCQAARELRSGYKFHFFPWFEQAEYRTPLAVGEVIEPSTDLEKRLVAMGVTAEQIKWHRQKVAEKGSASLVDQEYPSDPDTCFLVSGSSYFDQAITAAIGAQCREPIERRDSGRIWIFKRPQPGRQYVISADSSEGVGSDPSALIVTDRDTGEHVAVLLGQYQPWELARAAAQLGHEYNKALIAVERNTPGPAVITQLQREHNYPELYVHSDDRIGWPTNAVTRPVMLDQLEQAHRTGLWTTPDSRVVSHIKTFVMINGKPQAANGEHDDLVMAAAIGWAVRQIPRIDLSTWVA